MSKRVITRNDVELAGMHLRDALAVADLEHLASLAPEERDRQCQMRVDLAGYFIEIWEQAEARGEDPATDPLYAGVGAIRDVLAELAARAADPNTHIAGLRLDDPGTRAALIPQESAR